MSRNWLTGLALAAAALFGGWYYASPLYAMNALRNAAQAGDEAQLEASVDFPVLRENLKAELRARAESEMGELGGIGSALGMAILDPLIDGLVTPDAIATLVRQGNVLPDRGEPAQAAPQGEAEWTVEREGLSRFTARSAAQDGSGLVFERRGLGWKLVGIDLAEDAPPASTI